MFNRCPYFSINSLTREINRIWEEGFMEVGLSPSQGYVLLMVLEKRNVPQGEIADILNFEKSTLTRFVDSLVVKKLVKRVPSETDARTFFLAPTKNAERLKKRLGAVTGKLMEQISNKIPENKMNEFVLLTHELKELIREPNKGEVK